MMNIADLIKKIDQQKPIAKAGWNKWPFAGRTKFQAGRYRLRFCLNDEKCPNGFHIYTVHEIQKEACDRWSMTQEERDKAYFKILCSESYKGYRDDGKLAVPCPVCDVVHDISESYEDDGLIDRDLLKCVDEMSSNRCRKFLYPILIGASETDVTDDKGKSKKVYVPNDREYIGVILSLNAKNYEGNADLSLVKLIHAHVMNDENNLSSRRGRWFHWEKKSNGQTLSPAHGLGELPAKELETLSKMPNIVEFGASKESGPFAKNYKVGYDRGLSMLKQCWAIKALIQYHEYNMDSIERGQV